MLLNEDYYNFYRKIGGNAGWGENLERNESAGLAK